MNVFRSFKIYVRKVLRKILSEKGYIKAVYFLTFFRRCNLENPSYWTEKVQWKKLYDRRPLLTLAADKYRVREYVREKLGEDLLTKIYWAGEDPREIPFEGLPNSFVIKTNHGCGTNIIVKDKSQLDVEKTVNRLAFWLGINFFDYELEWAYKDIRKMVFVEEYISDLGESPEDFKFYMVNSECKMIDIHKDRFQNHVTIRIDQELNPFAFINKSDLPKTKGIVEYFASFKKPRNYYLMLKYAESLSEDFDFVRVDLYDLDNRVIFGELTNYPTGGWKRLPKKLDLFLGSFWRLPDKGNLSGICK